MQLIPPNISHPLDTIKNPQQIRNIIFDFGNVICNIDVKRTELAFNKLGVKSFKESSAVSNPSGIFEKFELGSISPDQFREYLKPWFREELSNQQIDDAWNALLLDIPAYRIQLLETLRNNYRIFLLSNSNQIHYDKYSYDFRAQYGYSGFEDLFEKAWFSFQIGLKKPHTVVFDYILEHGNLQPSETLFIDDTLMHVEGANRAGIHAHHLSISSGQEISFLFTN